MTPTLRELAEAAKSDHVTGSFRLALHCTPERILALLDCIAAADKMRDRLVIAHSYDLCVDDLVAAYDAKRAAVRL